MIIGAAVTVTAVPLHGVLRSPQVTRSTVGLVRSYKRCSTIFEALVGIVLCPGTRQCSSTYLHSAVVGVSQQQHSMPWQRVSRSGRLVIRIV
jgi:hypothetical protein